MEKLVQKTPKKSQKTIDFSFFGIYNKNINKITKGYKMQEETKSKLKIALYVILIIIILLVGCVLEADRVNQLGM